MTAPLDDAFVEAMAAITPAWDGGAYLHIVLSVEERDRLVALARKGLEDQAHATEVDEALEVWSAEMCQHGPGGTHISLAELSRCLLTTLRQRLADAEARIQDMADRFEIEVHQQVEMGCAEAETRVWELEEAVDILLRCQHGDEQTCTCRGRAALARGTT